MLNFHDGETICSGKKVQICRTFGAIRRAASDPTDRGVRARARAGALHLCCPLPAFCAAAQGRRQPKRQPDRQVHLLPWRPCTGVLRRPVVGGGTDRRRRNRRGITLSMFSNRTLKWIHYLSK
jgi:hypothetical protein